MQKISIKYKTLNTNQLLEHLITEIHALRHEFLLMFPQEDIKEYARPAKIKQSYQKAIKKYPPTVL